MTVILKLPPLRGLATKAMKEEPPPDAIPERMHFSSGRTTSTRHPKPSAKRRPKV
jgi:hypothetical protein